MSLSLLFYSRISMRAVLFEEQSKKKNDNKKNRENKSWLVSLAKVKKREGLKISKTYQTENKNLKKIITVRMTKRLKCATRKPPANVFTAWILTQGPMITLGPYVGYPWHFKSNKDVVTKFTWHRLQIIRIYRKKVWLEWHYYSFLSTFMPSWHGHFWPIFHNTESRDRTE